MTNLRDVISHCEGVIGNHTFLINKLIKADRPAETDDPTDEEMAESKIATEEAYMTTELLSGLNQGRYGVLLKDLHNDFHMGCDEHPKRLLAAYDMAINWKVDTKGSSVSQNYGMDFTI